MDSIQYLGLLVDRFGIKPTKKYKQKVIKINTPRNKKEMQRLIGLIGYIGKFIPKLYISKTII